MYGSWIVGSHPIDPHPGHQRQLPRPWRWRRRSVRWTPPQECGDSGPRRAWGGPSHPVRSGFPWKKWNQSWLVPSCTPVVSVLPLSVSVLEIRIKQDLSICSSQDLKTLGCIWCSLPGLFNSIAHCHSVRLDLQLFFFNIFNFIIYIYNIILYKIYIIYIYILNICIYIYIY